MPALGSVARQQSRGERNDHVGIDSAVENRAWAVWHSIRTGPAKAKGKPAKGPAGKSGDLRAIDGYEVEVNVTTKCKQLWPTLSQMDKLSQNRFLSEIRSFLTVSGNAVCVRFPGIGTGDHGQPLWWIRDTWNDVKGIPLYRTLELTDAERRLRPDEAGEDRPPAPVESRNGGGKAPQDDGNRTAVKSNIDRILEFVRAAEEPLYQAEIVRGLQINSIDVGRVLRSLIKKGQLHRRPEQVNERPQEQFGRLRYLYWATSPVPRRRTLMSSSKSMAMDLVAGLRAGETLRVSWMLEVDKQEIQEMVKAGLIEYTDKSETEVRQTEETAAKVAARSVVASNAAPEFPAETSIPIPERSSETPSAAGGESTFAEKLEGLLRSEIEQRVAALAPPPDAGRIDALKARVSELESKLIEARAEASEMRQLAERRARALRELTE